MTVQLLRIFNVFKWWAVVIIVPVAVAIGALIYYDCDIKYPIMLTLVVALSIFTRAKAYPESLTFDGRVIIYDKYCRRSSSHRDIDMDFEKPRIHRRTYYYEKNRVVMAIEKMELGQNSFERIFNAGHIRVEGKIAPGTCKSTPRKIKVRGIANYDVQKNEIERYYNEHKYDEAFKG